MAMQATSTEAAVLTGSAPVGIIAIGNGKPLQGVFVDISTTNVVKHGKTGYDGQFSISISPGEPVEIWVRKEDKNFGSGTGMWFQAAQVPGYARLGSSPVIRTVYEQPPAAGMGAMSMGQVDIFGWFGSVAANPLGALTSLPVFKEIAGAGAAAGAAIASEGSKVAATPVARQIVQTVSGGTYTTTPKPVAYTPAASSGASAVQKLLSGGAKNSPSTFVNVPVTSIKQQVSPGSGFDLLAALSATNKALTGWIIPTARAEEMTGGIAFKGAESLAPPTQRDLANNLPKIDAVNNVIANAKSNLDSAAREAISKGFPIPPEIEVTWLDRMACIGFDTQCAQRLYDTKNKPRNDAVKAYKAAMQAAADAAGAAKSTPSPASFTPTGISAPTASNAIIDQLSQGTPPSAYYMSVLADRTGISPAEVIRLTNLVLTNNTLLSLGQFGPGISGADYEKLRTLGLASALGAKVGGINQNPVRTAGGDTGIPDPTAPVNIPTLIPASSAPSGWVIQATGDPDTIIGVDPLGNRYMKYRKGDWRLIQGVMTTPENIPLGVFESAAKDQLTGLGQVGVLNPITGQSWGGNVPTMGYLTGTAKVKVWNPSTQSYDEMSCDELAASDPYRRKGASWTECEASEAWRQRYLYTNVTTGEVQPEPIAVMLAKKTAGQVTVANDIASRVKSGTNPDALSMYQKKIAEYTARMQQLSPSGVSSLQFSAAGQSLTQPNVPSVSDIQAKYLKNLELLGISYDATVRMGGGGVNP